MPHLVRRLEAESKCIATASQLSVKSTNHQAGTGVTPSSFRTIGAM